MKHNPPNFNMPNTDEEFFAEIDGIAKKKKKNLLLIGAVLFAVGFLIPPIWFFGALILAMYMIIPGKRVKALVSGYVTSSVLRETFGEVNYDHAGFIESDWIKQSRLIPRWTQCEGSDLVSANYKGVNISFSDIKLTHRETGGESNDTIIDFSGQWIIVALAKPLKAHLRLIERNPTSVRLVRKKASDDKDKSNFETENAEFNKKFQILADDPHTAFLILTPHFMEYINRMDKIAKAPTYKARTCRTYMWFTNDAVHIALFNNLNLFEPGIKKITPQNLPELRGRIKSEVGYITDVIDELLQNSDLF